MRGRGATERRRESRCQRNARLIAADARPWPFPTRSPRPTRRAPTRGGATSPSLRSRRGAAWSRRATRWPPPRLPGPRIAARSRRWRSPRHRWHWLPSMLELHSTLPASRWASATFRCSSFDLLVSKLVHSTARCGSDLICLCFYAALSGSFLKGQATELEEPSRRGLRTPRRDGCTQHVRSCAHSASWSQRRSYVRLRRYLRRSWRP